MRAKRLILHDKGDLAIFGWAVVLPILYFGSVMHTGVGTQPSKWYQDSGLLGFI